jgi:hypothetical protein
MSDIPEADRGRFSKMLYQYLLDDVARKQLKRQTNESIGDILMGKDDIELTEVGKRRKDELIRTRSTPRRQEKTAFRAEPFQIPVRPTPAAVDYSGTGWEEESLPSTPGEQAVKNKSPVKASGARRLSF